MGDIDTGVGLVEPWGPVEEDVGCSGADAGSVWGPTIGGSGFALTDFDVSEVGGGGEESVASW